jgi:hypothetical protein
MKLLGWCIRCRKVKRVNVRRPTGASVEVGTCDACMERNDKRK